MGLGDVCRSLVTLQRGGLLPWQQEACLGSGSANSRSFATRRAREAREGAVGGEWSPEAGVVLLV